MDLYIATTPYNIFNCIRVKEMINSSNKANIYINDFSSQNENIANRLSKTKIFENVFFVKNVGSAVESIKKRNILPRVKTKIEHTFFYKIWYKKLCGLKDINSQYDKIFLDVPNFLQRIIVNFFKVKNKKMIISLIDVGLESYIVAEKLTHSVLNKFYKNFEKLFINGAELFDENPNIVKIPTSMKRASLDKMNEVFQYVPNNYCKIETVFFDQYFEKNQENFMLDLIEKITNNGILSLAIKKHPRRCNLDGFDVDKTNFLINNGTYEMDVINKDVSDEQLLITIHSMAVALPKLLMDYEPYVIICCCLNPYKTDDDNAILNFFELIKKKYKDTNKFFIPKTEMELCENIKYVQERRKLC